jgi:hypothetical protein
VGERTSGMRVRRQNLSSRLTTVTRALRGYVHMQVRPGDYDRLLSTFPKWDDTFRRQNLAEVYEKGLRWVALVELYMMGSFPCRHPT